VKKRMADAKKPRVRKTETVRELTEKQTKKAEMAQTSEKGKARKQAKKAASKFSFLLWPFRLRPVRFLGRILVPKYFRDSFREIKLVTWPSRRETWSLTFAVLMFAVAFGVFITLIDIIFDKVIKRIVLNS